MPWTLLFRAVLLIGSGVAISRAFNKKIKPTKESDCSDEFIKLNDKLNVSTSKLKQMNKARKAVQERLREYFRNHPDFTIPKFAMQGSSTINTMIRNAKDTCDFDMGIYFFSERRKEFSTIQNHIKMALDGHTSLNINLLDKCVRLNYKRLFHIDMPVYYVSKNKEYYLGSKSNGWNICDSKLFKDWIIENTKDAPQKIRMVRYFKAWADNLRNRHQVKMPSGLAITIWVMGFYEEDKREDVAFLKTVSKLLAYFKNQSRDDWTAQMPVQPHDNVLDKLNSEQKVRFRKNLESMIKEAGQALTKKNKEDSQIIWKEVFGKHF